MNKRLLQMGVLAFAALCGMAFSFGGWAVVTVDDLPQAFTVGQPTTIAFSIRQHGVQLLDGLRPTLVAAGEKGGTPDVIVGATANGEGHYVATLTVPRPGNWSVTINTSFLNNRTKLYPIPAIAAGQRVKDGDSPADLLSELDRLKEVAHELPSAASRRWWHARRSRRLDQSDLDPSAQEDSGDDRRAFPVSGRRDRA
jgi:hypothetical protein